MTGEEADEEEGLSSAMTFLVIQVVLADQGNNCLLQKIIIYPLWRTVLSDRMVTWYEQENESGKPFSIRKVLFKTNTWGIGEAGDFLDLSTNCNKNQIGTARVLFKIVFSFAKIEQQSCKLIQENAKYCAKVQCELVQELCQATQYTNSYTVAMLVAGGHHAGGKQQNIHISSSCGKVVRGGQMEEIRRRKMMKHIWGQEDVVN